MANELIPFSLGDLDRFARTASGPFSCRQYGVLRGVPPMRITVWHRVGGFTGLHFLCTRLAEDWSAEQVFSDSGPVVMAGTWDGMRYVNPFAEARQ